MFIDPAKLLPLHRFLPKPPQPKGPKKKGPPGGVGGARGGFGRGGGGGRGGFGGRGKRDDFIESTYKINLLKKDFLCCHQYSTIDKSQTTQRRKVKIVFAKINENLDISTKHFGIFC